MDVNGIQKNLGNALVELETSIPDLTGVLPQEASIQINRTKAIVMDTQVRLSKCLNEMAIVERQITEVTLNQQQDMTQQVVNNLNETQDMETGAMAKNKKEIKAFNLKKQSQIGMESPVAPFGVDNFNDTAELGEERYNTEQNLFQEENLDRQSFTDFLIDLKDPFEVTQFVKNNVPAENENIADELAGQFNMIVDKETKGDEVDRLAGQIYDLLNDDIKSVPENSELGIPTVISKTNEILKKIAKDIVKKQCKAKVFNLKKTAQHKTQENVIMYGPENKKFDPFLRQPVSDWSIIERNKGFGLTFDDVWDIDYEAIWRGTIMDKYSRPYRDKDGNWVGGYIQKRFEVDKNIPETNNLQLKPGQLRRATPPEYGSTESRLQAARAAGEIKGGPDVNRTEPFNWKDASSKKKS